VLDADGLNRSLIRSRPRTNNDGCSRPRGEFARLTAEPLPPIAGGGALIRARHQLRRTAEGSDDDNCRPRRSSARRATGHATLATAGSGDVFPGDRCHDRPGHDRSRPPRSCHLRTRRRGAAVYASASDIPTAVSDVIARSERRGLSPNTLPLGRSSRRRRRRAECTVSKEVVMEKSPETCSSTKRGPGPSRSRMTVSIDDDGRRERSASRRSPQWLSSNPNPTPVQLAQAGLVAPHLPKPWGLGADGQPPTPHRRRTQTCRRATGHQPHRHRVGRTDDLYAGTEEQQQRWLPNVER